MTITISTGEYNYTSQMTKDYSKVTLAKKEQKLGSLTAGAPSVAEFQKILAAKARVLEKKAQAAASQNDAQSAEPISVQSAYVPSADTASNGNAATGQSQEVSASSQSSTASDNFSIEVPSSLKGIFEKAAAKYNVSEKLLEAVAWHESRFETDATSSSGAMGLMQLMPVTAESLGITDAYDAEQNVMGGAKLISDKLREFNGNLDLAMAAYSNGSGAVHRAGDQVPDIAQAKNFVAYIDSIFPDGI